MRRSPAKLIVPLHNPTPQDYSAKPSKYAKIRSSMRSVYCYLLLAAGAALAQPPVTIPGLTSEQIRNENARLLRAACPPPSTPKTPLETADAAFCAGDYERAATAYEAIQPPTRESAKFLVESRLAQHRVADAIALCERFLKADSNNPDLNALRASIRLDSAAPAAIPALLTELAKPIESLKDNAPLFTQLARASIAINQRRQARSLLDIALRAQAGYTPALVLRGALELEGGQLSTAQSTAESALALNPSLAPARTILINALLGQGRYDDAEARLADAIAQPNPSPELTYQLGFVRFRLGKYAEAEKLFEELYARTPPDMRGLAGISEIYAAQNQFAKALERLDLGRKQHPNDTGLKLAWANIAVRADRVDEAIPVYKQLAAAEPKNYDVQMRLAEAYRRKNDWTHAAEVWSAATAIRPNELLPLVNQAMALDHLKRSTEAAAIYEKILRINPNEVLALNNYAYFLAKQGKDLATALRYALRAAILAPGDQSIGDTLGFVYVQRKEPAEAVKVFERLVGAEPAFALPRIRLAEALKLNGDQAGARRECEAARPNVKAPVEKEEFAKVCGA